MNNFLRSLLLLFLFSVSTLNAQVAFDITSGTAAPGGTVDIDISVSNFTDIASIQFSLNWDASVYSFSSIENVTTDLPMFSQDGNIGTPPSAQAVDDGELTVSWSQVSTEPVDLPDDTRLFTVRLTTSGENCDMSSMTISNTPRITEISNSDFQEIGFTQSEGLIRIDNGDGTCDDPPPPGDGVGLIMMDINSPKGTAICLPVTTENFTDIASIQTGVTWDASILEFTEIKDEGLMNITANTANADNGQLRLLWVFDTEAVTVADGATLFELCFNVTGDTQESTEVKFENVPGLSIEVASGQGTSLDFFVENATVTVGSGGGPELCDTGVGLISPDIFSGSANNICIPVTTQRFERIAAIQAGIGFDPDVLQYTDLIDGELANAQIGNANADNGELRLLWTVDLGSNSISLDDNAVLFELCFDIVGQDGESSPIGFINIPNLAIEIVNEDAQAVDFCVDDGSITIGTDPNQTGDISLFATTHTVPQNDTVCVEISVDRFTDIQGMGFALRWDESVLNYINEQNFGLPNLAGSSNFNFVSPNTLRVLWTPPSPASVADNTVIFEVCYQAIGDCVSGSSSAIEFVSDLNPIEIINSANEVLEVDINNGMVTIDVCTGPAVTVLSATDPTCIGNRDGAVVVDFVNVSGAVSCTWIDADGNEVSTDCNLAGVFEGTYTLNATDEDNAMLSRTVILSDPSQIMASATIVNATCDRESALSVVITGGTSADGSYGLEWSGGLDADQTNFTNIPGGTFTVTITDDNGCMVDTSFTVLDSSIILDPVVTPVTNRDGNNGDISLNAATPNNNTYSWSNDATTESISGLTPGTYSVTVTDATAGCETVRTFELDWGAVFADDIISNSENSVTCRGEADGMISGDVIGGCDDGPIVVLVDGDEVTLPVTGLAAGDYEITIQDACGNTDVQTLTIIDPEGIMTSGVEEVECSILGESIGEVNLNLSGGTAPYSITSSAGTATADGRVTGLPVGTFTVVVTDANGCEFMIQNIVVSECPPPFDCDVARTIISPNGDMSNDNFEIGCLFRRENQPNELTIYDRWGNLMYSQNNYDNTWIGTDASGTELPEGGYHWVLDVRDPDRRGIFRGTVTILR